MNGRFSVKGLSKGRPACPSIFFSDFSGKDRALLVQQIGGANAGRGMNFSSKFVLGVVNRCLYGNARVLLCRCMKDGVPFPTSFWLVCPHLVKVAGRLEAENGMASMENFSIGLNNKFPAIFSLLPYNLPLNIISKSLLPVNENPKHNIVIF